MNSALWGLLKKETYHILRDRRTLTVVILLPIVQVLLFGFAISTDIRNVRIAFVDPTPDATTLELRNRFSATDVFRTVGVVEKQSQLERLFQTGAAQIAVAFEPNFAQELGRGEPAHVLIVSDAAEPNSGAARSNYVIAVIRQYESETRARSAAARRSGAVRIIPVARARFNPTLESANLFVPGLLALVLTIIAALMTALSLTREKEAGTLEALLVSPLRPWEIIVGKVAPYVVIGFVSVVAVLVEARVVFGVPIRGSVLLLLGEGLLFILVSLSIGILVSSRTSSQRVAMIATLVGTMLPTMLLSGFIFPLESMPRALQLLSNIIPARWFVFIERGIMLKGVGLTYVWRETLVLAAMAAVLLAASTRSFKVRLQ